jgi:hypothetical protein
LDAIFLPDNWSNNTVIMLNFFGGGRGRGANSLPQIFFLPKKCVWLLNLTAAKTIRVGVAERVILYVHLGLVQTNLPLSLNSCLEC